MTQLYAYVDETGDLGSNCNNPGTTQHFGMAAVVMDEAGAAAARQLITSLKHEWNVPSSKNFSWKTYVKTHERRKYISQRLATLEGVKVIYVFTDKSVVSGNYVQDRGYLYNYVAGKMFKNILYASHHWNGRTEDIKIRFSHVKGFDHPAVTKPYLLGKAQGVPSMDNMSELKWVNATQYKESDVADLFAGCLFAALKRDKYGNTEGTYLRNVWSLVRNSEQCSSTSKYCAIPLGFMPMPSYEVIRGQDWFVCSSCAKVRI